MTEKALLLKHFTPFQPDSFNTLADASLPQRVLMATSAYGYQRADRHPEVLAVA